LGISLIHFMEQIMKTKFLKMLPIIALAGIGLLPANSVAGGSTDKYRDLIQTLTCPADRAKYGEHRDYGYWKGGSWCGQQGKAGYWVWDNPTWYVFANKGSAGLSAAGDPNSANGKYSGLLQTINCPKDKKQYGRYKDYGYWGGGSWCGQQGQAGYWVWNNPNWYVWGNSQ
jgi:hypothetical protein